MFPYIRERRSKKIKMKQIGDVYCVCRMQEMGGSMVECSSCGGQYHISCVNIPQTVLDTSSIYHSIVETVHSHKLPCITLYYHYYVLCQSLLSGKQFYISHCECTLNYKGGGGGPHTTEGAHLLQKYLDRGELFFFVTGQKGNSSTILPFSKTGALNFRKGKEDSEKKRKPSLASQEQKIAAFCTNKQLLWHNNTAQVQVHWHAICRAT